MVPLNDSNAKNMLIVACISHKIEFKQLEFESNPKGMAQALVYAKDLHQLLVNTQRQLYQKCGVKDIQLNPTIFDVLHVVKVKHV